MADTWPVHIKTGIFIAMGILVNHLWYNIYEYTQNEGLQDEKPQIV